MNVPGTNSSGDHHDNGVEIGHDEREKLIASTLNERPLIVASNRGPVTFTAQGGGFTARQGSGGLVTAVSAVLQDHQAIWIAAAMTEGDRKRAALAFFAVGAGAGCPRNPPAIHNSVSAATTTPPRR